MTTTINKTDGSILAVVADGTVNSSTSMVLIGKNYTNYGDFLNENFIHLLENSASASAPVNPIDGQLWWDKTALTLKVWTGSAFKIISSSTSQDTPPSNPIVGDLWWDTFNGQLNVYNGTTFTLIGPAFTTAIGTSGTIVDSVVDTNGDAHVVIKVFIEETLVAVISKDSAYDVDRITEGEVFYASFTSIEPGFNLATDISGITFNGITRTSKTLLVGEDEVPPENFARTDALYGTETFYNPVIMANASAGLTLGNTSTGNIYSQTITGNTVILKNNISDASSDAFTFAVNIAGIGLTNTLIVGANAEVRLSSSPNVANGSSSSGLAIATVENVRTQTGNVLLQDGSRAVKGNLIPNVSSTWNLGSTSVRYNNLYTTNVIASSVQAATIGNTGSTITANSVSAAVIGNAGATLTGNTVTANTITSAGNINATVGLNAPSATIGTAIYAANYYFANGTPFIPGVASLNSQLGTVSIAAASGISVATTTGTITLSPTSGYNGYGVRTVSSSGPSGGSSGDIWYQV